MHWRAALVVLTTAALMLCSHSSASDTVSRDSTLNSLITQLNIATTNQDQVADAESLLPNSAEELENADVKPYGEPSPTVFRHKLLRSEQFRRLVGDLETCGTDLLSYGSGDVHGMFAQGAKSSIMSCREAIFTFIRWAKGDDSHLNLSTISGSELRRTGLYGHCECASPTTSMNPRLPSTNLNFESECEQLSLKGRSNIDAMEHLPTHLYPKRADSPIFPKPGTTGGSHVPDTPQLLKCKEDVCRIGDLKEICSKPKSRMTTAQIDVCKMCHPRDEARLHSYCSVREQREHRAFWVVAAMLGALTLAVGVAVVFNDCCRKRKRRGPAGGTATRREGEPGIYWRRIFGSIRCPIRIRRKPKAPREPLELELADVKDGMFTRTFCNSDGNSLIEYDKELGIKKVEKALIKTSTSGYYSEKTTVGCVPVMPRARASSPSLHQISIQSFIRSTRGSEASGVAVRESASNSPDPFSDDLWKAKYRAQGL